MKPELVQVLCWVVFGVLGLLCAHLSSKWQDGALFCFWVAVGIVMAVSGCVTLERDYQLRLQEMEECYRQEGPTCLATARRNAERWGGDAIKINGTLSTIDNQWATLTPSSNNIGHALVLYRDMGEYYEIKDSNYGRLNMYKSELRKVHWRYD